MLIQLARSGDTIALDFNAVAPLRAHGRMYKVVGGVSEALLPWPSTFGHGSSASDTPPTTLYIRPCARSGATALKSSAIVSPLLASWMSMVPEPANVD